MRIYALARLILHAFVLVFTICLLGISANTVALANKYHVTRQYAQLSLAVSVITLVVLIPVLVLDRLRRNALPSWTSVELGWNGVIWVLWLGESLPPSPLPCMPLIYPLDVEYLSYYLRSASEAQSVCQQSQAIEALAWLNWIILFALFWILLITALVYHTPSGGAIWMSSMADYTPAPSDKVASGGMMPMTQPTHYAGAPMAAGNPQMGYPAAATPGTQMSGVGGMPMMGTPMTQATQGHPGVAQV
ncbi:hypothetical protein DACRYDRAFT_105369 [Dacryopinax primogenitus]|uniref:MARVEL domain-containing protein n=1 Tax=Dacryopinax primogenitus (strain DJM 731) TaxID=1858805 RepID=M5GD71_DACPD|nr:uncharacterized protein DACRYDRAFT_105369 [Dacryopinax primogenitus]EJU04307.1 hypothetical protein DACRYDRAFT_105369 [Dacryopinax primogenitus]